MESTTGTNPDATTRRELAELLGLHPDSVSRLMSAGLAIAVEAWGGRGLEQRFDPMRAQRFLGAYRCRQVRECSQCRRVLEDCRAVAGHLITTRHSYGACPDCRPPRRLCQPCDLAELAAVDTRGRR